MGYKVKSASRVISLDEMGTKDDALVFEGLIASDHGAGVERIVDICDKVDEVRYPQLWALTETLVEVVPTFTKQQMRTFFHRYWYKYNVRATAVLMGVSHQAVVQFENAFKKKLNPVLPLKIKEFERLNTRRV